MASHILWGFYFLSASLVLGFTGAMISSEGSQGDSSVFSLEKGSKAREHLGGYKMS